MGADNTFGETNFNPNPPADGAEEINAKQVFDKVYEFYRNIENKPAIPLEARELIFSAMHQFATLHAQRIADKMIAEWHEQFKSISDPQDEEVDETRIGLDGEETWIP